MKTVKFEHKAVLGSPMSDAQATKYGLELQRLIDEVYPEGITPADVVREACIEASPLYDWFTWDLQKAAQKNWEREAGDMIRWIGTPIEVLDQKVKVFRTFQSVEVDEGRAYLSMVTIKASPDLTKQVLQSAKTALDGWRTRYKDYRDYFKGVFDAIDNI